MGEITVGKHTYFCGEPIRRGSMNNITIGSYCSIAEGVIFDSGFNHNINFVSTFPFNKLEGLEHLTGHPICKGDIVIGNDVWIGEHVMIMSGVTIGHGSIIGARSIVTKDVKPYSMVAGSPATFKKYRFNSSQIIDLLEIKWWEWQEDKIKQYAHLLMNDIDLFINSTKP